jgi:hypothetical protein
MLSYLIKPISVWNACAIICSALRIPLEENMH